MLHSFQNILIRRHKKRTSSHRVVDIGLECLEGIHSLADKILGEHVAVAIVLALADESAHKISLHIAEDIVTLPLALHVLEDVEDVWHRSPEVLCIHQVCESLDTVEADDGIIKHSRLECIRIQLGI